MKEKFIEAVHEYQKALEDMWQISDGYWVSGELGGTYIFEDYYAMNLQEMILLVDEKVRIGDFKDWTEYNLKADEYGFSGVNLKSYLQGAPLVPHETFQRLDSLKKNLQDAIEEEKKKMTPKESWVISELSREDLEGLDYDTSNITDDEMERLAGKLGDDYCEQLFWTSLKVLADEYFEFPRKMDLK